MSNLCILGLWHQGIVASACLAEAGYDVLAAEPNPALIDQLRAGHAPIFEPGLDDLLEQELKTGRLHFTTDARAATEGRLFVFLMHDTPVDENDQSDLSVVFKALEAAAPALADGVTLVVTAQVPVGTCDQLAARLGAMRPGLAFSIVYIPENLRLGQAIDRFRKPPLPVMGSDDPAALDRVAGLLAPFSSQWLRVGLRAAEMTKHALNAFLATCVTFGNELGSLCDELGADAYQVVKALRMEERIGPKAMLLPGLGFSGGTLARDMQTLRGLGTRHGVTLPLLDGVWESNRQRNRLVVTKLTRALGGLRGRPLAVLGLTYKPDTSTLRRSAALEIIGYLADAGATLKAHDPRADRAEVARCTGFSFCESPYDAAAGAAALVLITPWKEYRHLDFARLRAAMVDPAVILDTANLLDGATLTKLGFKYLDIGRGRAG